MIFRTLVQKDFPEGYDAFISKNGISHHVLWAHKGLSTDFIESGFGYQDKHLFSTYPFIRNFFGGGHYAVSTFFVISGYVLSTKPLSFIHAGEQAQLADNLASALFRRWLRLYIPLLKCPPRLQTNAMKSCI